MNRDRGYTLERAFVPLNQHRRERAVRFERQFFIAASPHMIYVALVLSEIRRL